MRGRRGDGAGEVEEGWGGGGRRVERRWKNGEEEGKSEGERDRRRERGSEG